MTIKPMPTTMFFAVPCGDFFSPQSDIIRKTCELAGVKHDIVEDDSITKQLWDKITARISEADFFVADISSGNANVILELGFALKEKPLHRIAIFKSRGSKVLSDLSGFLRQEYSSIGEFRSTLIRWLVLSIPGIKVPQERGRRRYPFSFQDDFMNPDSFIRHWSIPAGGQYSFTGEGIRITDMHLPMLTQHLGLLGDHEFAFSAKIQKRTIGWVVKGTYENPNQLVPSFCIMFNINEEGTLSPHIWNLNRLHPQNGYHRLERQEIELKTKFSGRSLDIKTVVTGDNIRGFDLRQESIQRQFLQVVSGTL